MARRRVAAVAGVALVGCLAAVRAQTPAGSQDIMPALLSEVRALRAAMEQMATTGARVQLTLGRLQLQEQRLNTTIRRLDETRTRLADHQRSVAEMQEQMASIETITREGIGAAGFSVAVSHPSDRPPAEHIEEMQKHFKRQIVHMNSEIQRLTLEEATLAADVSNEQARWLEFNQKLEELERGLVRR